MKNQMASMMVTMQQIFKQMETFMIESLSNNYEQEEIEKFHVMVGLMAGKSVVDFDLFDEETKTIFRYSITLDKMLKQCANKSVYPILEDKLKGMVRRSYNMEASEEIKIVQVM